MSRAKAWRPREVKVFWTDAYETHKITGTKEQVIAAAKLYPRETKGFLVYHDEERTILSRHYDPPSPSENEEPEVDSIIVIPTVLVKAIKPNGEKRTKKIPQESRAPAQEAGDGKAQ